MDHETTTGIMFILVAPSGQVLVQLRDDGQGKHIRYPNTWAFPGGRKRNDESYIDAALREISEECGLRLRREDFRLLMRMDCGTSLFRIHVFICNLRRDEVSKVKVFEGKDMRWVNVGELKDLDLGFCQEKILPYLEDYLRSRRAA